MKRKYYYRIINQNQEVIDNYNYLGSAIQNLRHLRKVKVGENLKIERMEISSRSKDD